MLNPISNQLKNKTPTPSRETAVAPDGFLEFFVSLLNANAHPSKNTNPSSSVFPFPLMKDEHIGAMPLMNTAQNETPKEMTPEDIQLSIEFLYTLFSLDLPNGLNETTLSSLNTGTDKAIPLMEDNLLTALSTKLMMLQTIAQKSSSFEDFSTQLIHAMAPEEFGAMLQNMKIDGLFKKIGQPELKTLNSLQILAQKIDPGATLRVKPQSITFPPGIIAPSSLNIHDMKWVPDKRLELNIGEKPHQAEIHPSEENISPLLNIETSAAVPLEKGSNGIKPPLTVNPQIILEQLVSPFRKMPLKDGVSELQIALHPQELGEIQLNVRVENHMIHIVSQSNEVTALVLQQNLLELKSLFEANGLSLGSFVMNQFGQKDRNPPQHPSKPRKEKSVEMISAVSSEQKIASYQGFSHENSRLNVMA